MARLFTGREVVDNWNPLDGVPAPEYIPSAWNGPHVAARLADAWRTLSKVVMPRFLPRGFGRLWPPYTIEWDDLLSMVGAGEYEALQREANRVRVLPSAKEISQMEQAIHWPLDFLDEPRQVLIVNVCARMLAIDGDLQREIRRRNYGGDSQQWQQLNWRYCDTIADNLIKDRVVVF
jgi:hypothetical protein